MRERVHNIFSLMCSHSWILYLPGYRLKFENPFFSRTEFLQKWFVVLPNVAYENITQAYLYNCNTWVREYTKFHERILMPLKNNRKLIFIDTPSRLNDYISPDQQKLPGGTLSLDEDLKEQIYCLTYFFIL